MGIENNVKLLSVDVNKSWIIDLMDLIDNLDDLLFTFGIPRRVNEMTVRDCIQRWAHGNIFTLFEMVTKKHIGLCGFYQMNIREPIAYAWLGVRHTNDRHDETEIKKTAYIELIDNLVFKETRCRYVIVKVREGSKDTQILQDIGCVQFPYKFETGIFVDGRDMPSLWFIRTRLMK